MNCLECGQEVLQPARSGAKSRLCSYACKRLHRRKYIEHWAATNRGRIAKKRDAIRDQVRAWNRDFYARHRERRRLLRLGHYQKNTEASLKKAREYAKAHPNKIRTIGRKSRMTRRARLAEAFVETIDPAVVFERGGGICGICTKPIETDAKWHVDHITPLAKGGAHSYDNVQPAHAWCNHSKGAKIIPCLPSPS